MINEKLTGEELDGIVGGTLYVSIDGGDKINASVGRTNGTMHLYFEVDGETVDYDTGVDLSGDNVLGKLEYAALDFIDSQGIINHTYKISTDDEDSEGSD